MKGRSASSGLGYVLKGYPRISETFISNEILLLEKLGFTISIFSMRRPREDFSHDSVKQIKASVDYLPETIRGHEWLLFKYNLLLALRKPSIYAKACLAALRRFRRTRKAATIKHLLQAGYLVEHLLPGKSVRHLHAHFAHSPTSVAMFASLLSGLPFSFTAHAKDIYTSDTRQLKEKIRLADYVVTCTEYNRRYMARLADGAGTPLYRIYHGINLDYFAGEQGHGDPRPPYRILTVARLTEKKGLPTVYRALRLLRDQGLQFRHVLIGDGDERDSLGRLIADLGLADVTECLGTQPHTVVLEHYRRADLFVLGCELAANGDRDGIPNVLVEAMAMGVPVVATDISAIPELVESGHTGLLVGSQSPEALAVAMTRLLTDGELRERLVERARSRVAELFDNTALINQLAVIHGRALAVAENGGDGLVGGHESGRS
jgi:glycosyltransferase involved in cell wall biosynthesis